MESSSAASAEAVQPLSTFASCLASLALGLSYVLSMHVWGSTSSRDRDHPSTIKRRFVSAACMLFISPPFVVFFGSRNLLDAHALSRVIGLRSDGLLEACLIPLGLTVLLFLGPVAMFLAYDTRLRVMLQPAYWLQYGLRDLIWWRNHVVAPWTEEFTFRACMVPVLLNAPGATAGGVVLTAPLFFGVAHLHHMAERLRKGQDPKAALAISLFQMTYTTLFGMYSAFLFVRTGHLAAPAIVHGFCNFMGFPDFAEVANLPARPRALMVGLYLIGLAAFYVALFPLTEPSIYSNDIYASSS